MLKKNLLALVTVVLLAVMSLSGVLTVPVTAEAAAGKISITKKDCKSLKDMEKETGRGLSDSKYSFDSGPLIARFSFDDADEYFLWIPFYEAFYNITNLKKDTTLKCIDNKGYYEIDLKVREADDYSVIRYESDY